jgi:hypothetical protein
MCTVLAVDDFSSIKCPQQAKAQLFAAQP